jgi:hypothetical protein
VSFRFYRRVRLLPGLRVNLSRGGPSISVGTRGAWYTVGPRGRRVTVGLPGSGIYWTEQAPPAPWIHGGHRLAFIIVAVVALLLMVQILRLVPAGVARQTAGIDPLQTSIATDRMSPIDVDRTFVQRPGSARPLIRARDVALSAQRRNHAATKWLWPTRWQSAETPA